MTDQELRDAAVVELKKTTQGYLKSSGQPRPAVGAQWKKGLDLLSQIGQVVEPPAAGSLIFDADNEVANVLSQWTALANGNPNRVFTTTAENGVTPRQGARMLRCDAWPGEYASWSTNHALQAAIVQKSGISGSLAIGSDTYTGGAFYFVPGFQAVNSQAHVTLAEYHGVGPMSQAPWHFGVLGNGGGAGQWYVDLHRNQTGYSPVFQPALGAMITGQWMNWVVRFKSSAGSDGRFTFWLKVANGSPMTSADIKHDYTGPTSPLSGESLYPILGLYRGTGSNLGTVYHDLYKIGTTREIVDPGR